jgi:uncharacterized membrane protein
MKLPSWLNLLLIIAAAAAVRLLAVDVRPIWLDEAYALDLARLTVGELWGEVLSYELHPPLYPTLLHFWTTPFGESELALRMSSLVFGVLTVPVAFFLGRRCASSADRTIVGLIAALLLAFSPINTLYSVQARPYALLAFASTLFLLAVVALADRMSDSRANRARSSGVWLLLIGAGATMLWLHNTAILTVATVGLCLAAVTLFRTRSLWEFSKIALAGCAILALWSPYLPWFLHQSGTVAANFWTDPLTVRHTAAVFLDVFAAGKLPLVTLPGLGEGHYLAEMAGTAMVLLAGTGAVHLWKTDRWPTMVLLVAASFAPFTALVIVSYVSQPILLPRVLIGSSIPFYVLVAAGFARLPSLTWRVLTFGLIGGLLMLGTLNQFLPAYSAWELWDQAAKFVADNDRPDDAVWLYPNHNELPFDYYFDDPARTRGLPQQYPAPNLDNDYPLGNKAVPTLSNDDSARLADELRDIRRLWCVTRGSAAQTHENELLAMIGDQMELVSYQEFGSVPASIIRVRLYARRD